MSTLSLIPLVIMSQAAPAEEPAAPPSTPEEEAQHNQSIGGPGLNTTAKEEAEELDNQIIEGRQRRCGDPLVEQRDDLIGDIDIRRGDQNLVCIEDGFRVSRFQDLDQDRVERGQKLFPRVPKRPLQSGLAAL